MDRVISSGGKGMAETAEEGLSMRKPSLAQVSILYSLAVLLLLYIGFRVQKKEFYSGILLTEFVLILLPPLILLFVYKFDFKRLLRLNRVGGLNLFLIFCIMIFALPVVGGFNAVNLLLIEKIFGQVIPPAIPPSKGLLGLFINILMIAGTAGICEEILFRGVIMRGLERFGAARAILITGLLFGLVHLDFQRLLGTFMLGALIGFIVYRTNSLYGGMFAHFTNNSLAVFIAFIAGGVSPQDNAGSSLQSLGSMPRAELIMAIAILAFFFAAAVIILGGLILAFTRATSDKAEIIIKSDNKGQRIGALWLLPGILFIVLMYIAEGFKLKGIDAGMLTNILHLIGLR